MKKITVITALLLAVNLGFLHGQETERKYAIQVNPLLLVADLFTGAIEQDDYSYSLSFEFQYAISNYWNIIVRPNFLTTNSSSGYGSTGFFFSGAHKNNKNHETRGTDIILSVMPGILYRPFGMGLNGLYMGLYPNIGWENRKYEHYTGKSGIVAINDNFFIAGIGLEAGYEWIFKSGFSILVGAGLERNWGIEFEENKGEYEDPKSLYHIRIAFFLGYSF
ncbi:MAG: hypothetical protein LBK63_04155 [Treponema sp.]|jgi:hypothetical protein|nr:hypothetical protein [Treponema sp.]